LLHTDRFGPGRVSQFLRNIQNFFKQSLRLKMSFWHGMPLHIFHLVTFLHPNPQNFPIKKS